LCDAAVPRLVTLPARTPSLRLLADQAAEVLAGMSRALNGLALLVADPARPVRGRRRLRVPDWLPSLVNAGRAFVVIGAAELFWIVTEWPSGAQAITFAAIGVILFAPRADQAYDTAIGFMIGSILTACITAILKFAVLLDAETFAGFSLIIGFVLVPVGAFLALQWQPAIFTGMVTPFVPLLAPANLREIARHESAEQGYMDEGVQILELARNAQRLFERQEPREKRRLLNFVLSNCTWEDGEVVASFRQPFDLLAEITHSAARQETGNATNFGKQEIWLGD
jgi:hypothetical protein